PTPQETSTPEQPNTPLSLSTLLWRIYTIGVAVMVFFNFNCYPGSEVGLFGWAIIWPLYVPANLIRFAIALQAGDNLTAAALWGEVCQDAIIGIRAPSR
ncbi:MAG: hypothetical protein AAF125_25270, partial [Chloroflexota bacterium]